MTRINKKNRFIAFMLVLMLVMAIMPVGAMAATYGDVTISIPSGEDATLPAPSQSGSTYTYTVQGTPFYFSLKVEPDTGATVTVTGHNGATVTQDGTLPGNTDYWLVTPSATQASYVQVVSSGGNTYIINCNIPSGNASAGAGIYAYLPAPGQYTNEGINTGGWGDAFVSGSTGLKGMVNAISSTGMSLGYFGGYAVFDMGEDIANNASNSYGVDFIVYGNAFANNSEPGGIQVAEGASDGNGGFYPADVNGDGIIWYDIAGSLHYDEDTVWNASYTYTNPYPADDVSTTYPNTGTAVTSPIADNNVPYTFSNTYRPGTTAVTGSGSVVYNTFHRHAWFPLVANYFTARGSFAATAKTGSFPFAAHTTDTTNGSTLTLKGVMPGKATNIQTANYTFGYADVHPNGSNYGVAANPYAATGSTNGGDGIDISWAVKPDGTPVSLSSIRFVRVYTAAASMNPTAAFGEISTEICGIYKVSTANGAGAATKDLTVRQGTVPISNINNMGTVNRTVNAGTTATFNITSGADYVYVNGVSVGSSYSLNVNLAVGETKHIQIITQTGTYSPFVTVITVTGV